MYASYTKNMLPVPFVRTIDISIEGWKIGTRTITEEHFTQTGLDPEEGSLSDLRKRRGHCDGEHYCTCRDANRVDSRVHYK